ncbi:hypothetical protein ABT336_07210 [Micromonospora sp. NPDC000207]|uniref:hypothetical protein n=1 Tax=Micromonospora sp. NPDC000207 TaxID=3154246 RepID=UPI00333207A5
MAIRTWSRLLLTALAVSTLAGAGQLGVTYAFGILRLIGEYDGADANRWPGQLVWVGWCAAVAATTGAVVADRLLARDGPTATTARRLAVAGVAGLGATVVVPLCTLPARAAEIGTGNPAWPVAVCAVLGAVVGTGAALAALWFPPLGWNMGLVTATIWLVALFSVAPSVFGTGPLPFVRLGVVEPAWLDATVAQRLAPLLLPLLALLAGAATGWLARAQGHPTVLSAVTGVAGPALVAFTHLTAGPGNGADQLQFAPYLGGLIAVGTGALGSAAATAWRWPLFTPAARATGAIEPTDILDPLPADGDDLPSTGEPIHPKTSESLSSMSTPDTPTRPPAEAPTDADRTLTDGGSAPTEPGPTPNDGDPVPTGGPADPVVPTGSVSPTYPVVATAADGSTDPADRGPEPDTGSSTAATPAHWDWPTVTRAETPRPIFADDDAPRPPVAPVPVPAARPAEPPPAAWGTEPTPAAREVQPPTATWEAEPPAAVRGAEPPPAVPETEPTTARVSSRFPSLPDLSNVSSWNAFTPPRRSEPEPEPDLELEPVEQEPEPVPVGVPAEAAEADPSADGTTPTRSVLRFFRRNRNRTESGDPTAEVPRERGGKERPEPEVPAQDEEYVDWVTGLGRPTTEPETGKRRLGSSGRHSRD